jgi:hypothetical protein
VRYPKRKLPLNAEKWVQCCWADGILQGPFLSSFLDILLSSDLGCCLLMYTITALESAQEHVRKLSYISPCMWWQSDMKLKKFLSIIESSLVYPVLYDSKRWVLCVFRSSLSSWSGFKNASVVLVCLVCSMCLKIAQNFGLIVMFLSTPTVGSWWNQLVPMAACHCYLWWRWWSDTLWATLIRLWLHFLSCYLQNVVEISLQSPR